MIRLTIVTAAMVFLVSAGPAAADFQAGLEAHAEQNYEKALAEWTPLADGGDMEAQYRIGLMHIRGQGVETDYFTAGDWMTKAAASGHKMAQYSLGIMHFNGTGRTQDYAEAARYLTLSAGQGYGPALLSIGVMTYNGQGVAQDNMAAHVWLNLAAARGEENAIEYRKTVEQEMEPEEIAEAQAKARDWRTTN